MNQGETLKVASIRTRIEISDEKKALWRHTVTLSSNSGESPSNYRIGDVEGTIARVDSNSSESVKVFFASSMSE